MLEERAARLCSERIGLRPVHMDESLSLSRRGGWAEVFGSGCGDWKGLPTRNGGGLENGRCDVGLWRAVEGYLLGVLLLCQVGP